MRALVAREGLTKTIVMGGHNYRVPGSVEQKKP